MCIDKSLKVLYIAGTITFYTMQKILLFFTLTLTLMACANHRVEQLEAENAQLKIEIDSLTKEVQSQAQIAIMQKNIAQEQEQIAKHEAERARIAEDSAAAALQRLAASK